MEQLSVGVVGAGYWSSNIIRNLLQINSISKVYLYDISKERATAVASKFSPVVVVNDYQELLKLSDAVCVVTPIISHFPLALQALDSGCDVFIEKPITRYYEDAVELGRVAQDNKLVLMGGYTFLYSEEIRWIKKYIDSGKLGDIIHINFSWLNQGLYREDANCIWDCLPHAVSVCLYLFDWQMPKVDSLASFVSTSYGNNIDLAFLGMRFNAVPVWLQTSWINPEKVRKIYIIGSKRSILYDHSSINKVSIINRSIGKSWNMRGGFVPVYNCGDIEIPDIVSNEPLYSELVEFIDCCLAKRIPLCDAAHSAMVVKVLELCDWG